MVRSEEPVIIRYCGLVICKTRLAAKSKETSAQEKTPTIKTVGVTMFLL